MTTVVPTPAMARVIHLAILLGALAFGAVVLFLTTSEGAFLEQPVLGLGWAAIAMSAIALITALAMRSMFVRRARNATGDLRVQLCFVAMLVPVALLEGAILFLCVVWLVEGNPAPYAGIAGFLFLVAMALPMPRPESLEQ